MAVKLYVGNIPWSTTTDDLRQLFGQFGEVEDAFIPQDRETGGGGGYGGGGYGGGGYGGGY